MAITSSHGVAGRPAGAGRRRARGPRRRWLGRVAEAFQHGADAGPGLGVERGPGGGDVLADLVEQLLAAAGRQVAELGLQVLEVAEDQGVDLGGHGLSSLPQQAVDRVGEAVPLGGEQGSGPAPLAGELVVAGGEPAGRLVPGGGDQPVARSRLSRG